MPFKEDGMQYLLASPASEYVTRIFDNIDAETTFIDGILYLLARDRFPAGDIEIVDILHIEANSILLPYHESSRAFKMRVDSADFGDTATYTFKTVAAQ